MSPWRRIPRKSANRDQTVHKTEVKGIALSRVSDSSGIGIAARCAIGLSVVSECLTRPVSHRGYWRIVRRLTGRLHGSVTLELEPGKLTVSLSDPYWMRMVASGYQYEPEVQDWLSRVTKDSTDLVDVGANIGFWPAWFGARNPGSRVVAVEPNTDLGALLRINTGRVQTETFVVECAVAPRSGSGTATFHVNRAAGLHANASLMGGMVGPDSHEMVEVPIASLDSILTEYRRPGHDVIVKLDIEGLETAVLQSLRDPDDSELLFLYEDHGRDSSCEPTQWLLANTGRQVWLLVPNQSPIRIESSEMLSTLKSSPKIGYNLVALPPDAPMPITRANGSK